MPTTQYKEARVCACGYTTMTITYWSRHKKSCKLVKCEKDARIASLEKQLAVKDEQIKELIKRPRTVNNNTTNNNRYVVEQHINVFGKESINHITPAQIRALLADPANAVPQFIKLKYRRAPGGVNNNVRIPNQKRAIYQVVVQYRRMMGRSNGRIRRRGMYWNSFTMTILGRVGG